MKISSSVVGMEAAHQSISVQQSSLRLGVRMDKSEWEASQALLSGDPAKNDAIEEGAQEHDPRKEESRPAALVDLSKHGIDASKGLTAEGTALETEKVPDKTMSTLRALLQYLKSVSNNPKAYEKLEEYLDGQEKLAQGTNGGQNHSFLMGMAGAGRSSGAVPTVMVDRRETFTSEMEYTKFSAGGMAKTEDGRELSFNVEFEMSRSFMEYTKSDKLYTEKPDRALVCDPLVINVGANVASVSDQKFRFDLDADGKEDEISMLGEGSGFLALDENEDGRINDGTELFGPKSGNGFADLAEHDEDHNGWIDENDDVFDKLKVWYRHEDGTDRLIGLKEADVGAIYLGNTSTEFSMKSDESHDLNGVLRSSGVFLRESVGAGTIQHVDLAL